MGSVRFPDASAEVAAQLIRSIWPELGEAVLDRLIDARLAEPKAACAGGLDAAWAGVPVRPYHSPRHEGRNPGT